MNHARSRALLATAVFALLAAIFTAAYAGAAGKGTQVKTASTSLGKIVVNAKGHALYMFASDKNGKSTCYGSCAHYWPPLTTTGKPVAGTGAKASLLGTTKRTNGTLQVTYKGHHLYLYVGDSQAGQTSGQGLNLSGGLWWVLSPTGAVIKKTASGGSGGGGGGNYP